MYPEGTKACKVCGHILWREEETTVCLDCKETWRIIAQAVLQYLPNNRVQLTAAGVLTDSEVEHSGGN